jgi:hypothetical protein
MKTNGFTQTTQTNPGTNKLSLHIINKVPNGTVRFFRLQNGNVTSSDCRNMC